MRTSQKAEAPLEWLYDEVGLCLEGASTGFTHNILLTSGDEMRLTFREFHMARKHTMPALSSLTLAMSVRACGQKMTW